MNTPISFAGSDRNPDPWKILKAYGGPGLFITGTGTGIGKTTVTAALAGAFSTLGIKVGVCKAIASGCPKRPERVSAEDFSNNDLLSPDAAISGRMAGLDPTDDRMLGMLSPIRYAAAVSPHIAARLEDRPPDWRALSRAMEYWRTHCDLLLVEGAGGWLVPLDDRLFTVADMASIFVLPVVLVTGVYLGTLNHTWLTAECIRHRNLPLVGMVANHVPDPPDMAAITSLDELPHIIHAPLLATLPRVQRDCTAAIPEGFVQAMVPFARQWWDTVKARRR